MSIIINKYSILKREIKRRLNTNQKHSNIKYKACQPILYQKSTFVAILTFQKCKHAVFVLSFCGQAYIKMSK